MIAKYAKQLVEAKIKAVKPATNAGEATLFQYTDEVGPRGILESGNLNPSLKSTSPKEARYGDGQYLTDIAPVTKTCAQLSHCFLGIPATRRMVPWLAMQVVP